MAGHWRGMANPGTPHIIFYDNNNNTTTTTSSINNYDNTNDGTHDISNPNTPEKQHEDPDELLARFDKERASAAALREELRQVLAAALGGEGQA